MRTRLTWFLTFLLLVNLVGCTSLPFGLGNGLQPGTRTPKGTPGMPASATSRPNAIPTATEENVPPTQLLEDQILRIWLPPQFDPEENNPASKLLKMRLNEFKAENPKVQLEVRLKALDGPGGMLDSLVAANAAAPSDLPDLALLPRPLLESAAVKGLLYPYDGLTNIMDDQTWFEYALQLAHLKSSTYGIPFAGDIMVLAHSTSDEETTPVSLENTLTQANVLLYPAGEPQALFTLCMYLAEGGKLRDDQGRPTLEETPLINILNYDQQANLAGVMPYTLTQYTNDSQVWEAMLTSQYQMGVTWTHTYLSEPQPVETSLAMAALPTPDGVPFTLATGWSWVLAGKDSTHLAMDVRLAEFLIDKEFLAEWTQAAGYLPPRVDALQSWPINQSRQVIEQVSYSAWLVPSADLISTIGPLLQQAVKDVLEGRSDPQSAAHASINQINQP
jgi:multiple sugar transport system substrate-binding protein